MIDDLGEKLRTLRKKRGLTTQQLADKVAVSQSYISRFENNRAVPDVALLDTILTALDSNLAEFFQEHDEMISTELLQLIETVKRLSPEAQKKLNDFLKVVHKK